jgi:hypothetical protein
MSALNGASCERHTPAALFDALLTMHSGTLMNQHQLDTLFLVCLLEVNAATCFGRYSSIFMRPCTDAVWCNYVRIASVQSLLKVGE